MGTFSLIVVAFAIFLIPTILFLLTLQNTLKRVRKKNRMIEPGQVWLNLIPLFNIVWQFIMINRIADSLKNEFSERNIPIEEDRPGAQIGVAYCILNLCGVIPVLGGLASLAGLVCWIIYWVKISNYKNQLGEINEDILDDYFLDDFDLQAPRPAQKNITGDSISPSSSTTLTNQNEKIYYVNIDDEQLGPYDLKKIRSLIQLNKINSDTLIWKDGMKEWDNSKNIHEINKLLY